MDPEMRAALDELREDLRGEIRAGDAETRAYVDTRLAALSLDMGEWRAAMRRDLAETQAAMRQHLVETQVEMRRHFDVVAESIRADVHVFAEALGSLR